MTPKIDDPDAYLVQADWLEERGDRRGADAARGNAAVVRTALEAFRTCPQGTGYSSLLFRLPVRAGPFVLGLAVSYGMKVRLEVVEGWPEHWQGGLNPWTAQVVEPTPEKVALASRQLWFRVKGELPLWGRRVAILHSLLALPEEVRRAVLDRSGVEVLRRAVLDSLGVKALPCFLPGYTAQECGAVESALEDLRP